MLCFHHHYFRFTAIGLAADTLTSYLNYGHVKILDTGLISLLTILSHHLDMLLGRIVGKWRL